MFRHRQEAYFQESPMPGTADPIPFRNAPAYFRLRSPWPRFRRAPEMWQTDSRGRTSAAVSYPPGPYAQKR